MEEGGAKRRHVGSGADTAPYIVNFTQVDTDGNGVISIAEFQAACGKGLVKYTNH
jgi:hypothetical protein